MEKEPKIIFASDVSDEGRTEIKREIESSFQKAKEPIKGEVKKQPEDLTAIETVNEILKHETSILGIKGDFNIESDIGN